VKTAPPRAAPSRLALARSEAAFLQASSEAPAEHHSVHLELGGLAIRLSVVGTTLWEYLAPPLSHLASPRSTARPGLTIKLWDAARTGIAGPFATLPEILPTGKAFGFGALGEDRREAVAGYQTPAACMLLDRKGGLLAGWVRDPHALSSYEIGKPLQPLLFAWARDRDILPVHAALVAHRGRGVLLGGRGGSGKSTSALSCLNAGFQYLGDDYIGVPAPEGSRFVGHSFYNTSWLEASHAHRFPWLAPALAQGTPSRGNKLLIRPDALFGRRMAASVPIHLLVLPRINDGETVTRAWRIRPAEAVLRLAPSSILQLPFNDPRRLLDRMTELAHAVPCYHLELGTDLAGIPRSVEGILEEVS